MAHYTYADLLHSGLDTTPRMVVFSGKVASLPLLGILDGKRYVTVNFSSATEPIAMAIAFNEGLKCDGYSSLCDAKPGEDIELINWLARTENGKFVFSARNPNTGAFSRNCQVRNLTEEQRRADEQMTHQMTFAASSDPGAFVHSSQATPMASAGSAGGESEPASMAMSVVGEGLSPRPDVEPREEEQEEPAAASAAVTATPPRSTRKRPLHARWHAAGGSSSAEAAMASGMLEEEDSGAWAEDADVPLTQPRPSKVARSTALSLELTPGRG